MSQQVTSDSVAKAPWDAKRVPDGKHIFRRFISWLAGILLLGVVAWGLWPKPVLIETGVVARAPLTVRVSEEGKTRVRNRYIVASPVAGRMHRVLLKPGDPVVAGETLLTRIEPILPTLIDPRTRLQAEAVVSMREASRKQAAESLVALRSALDLAVANRERTRNVKTAGTLSQADRDLAEAQVSIKAAEVRAAEFSQQVLDYELAQANAALDRPDAKSPDDRIDVQSPVSGRVLNVFQESETPLNLGAPILEVGDPADIEIEAEILSRDAVNIRPGDSVEIDQWGGEHPLQGRVRRIEPAAFTKISALGVEEQRVIVLSDLVDPPEAAKLLGDRYRVEVRVAIWHHDDVLVIPSGALFREGDAWKTYLYQDGKARLTAVTAGHSDGRFTEILTGLSPGQRVLLHPPDVVKDGTTVHENE